MINRQKLFITISSICLVVCLAAGLATVAMATSLINQAIGATITLFSVAGFASCIFALRVPPEQISVKVPIKISLQQYLNGLEQLLAGDTNRAVTTPEQLIKAERKQLDEATANIRRLIVDKQNLNAEIQRLQTADHIPVPQAHDDLDASHTAAAQPLSAAQTQQLSALSTQLEKLASKLLAATSSSEENRDGTQEQLASLKLQARKLGDRTRLLADTVDLLKDLAEQSGVLALNAAIQASRSGESGLGVVADELQRVANRHSDASRQLEESLLQLNNEIGEANDMIDSGREHLSKGQHDLSQLRSHIAALARSCGDIKQHAADNQAEFGHE